MRKRLLLPVALLLTAVTLTGATATPSLGAATPTADELLVRSALALKAKDSLHLDVDASSTTQTDGSLTPVQARKLMQPFTLTASADLSPTAVTLSGKLVAAGKPLSAELRSSGKELYVNLFGSWYGTKTGASAGSSIPTTDPKALQRLGASLKAINATVTAGPEVDGVATWKVTGSIDGPALAKALRGAGVAAPTKDVTRLARHTELTALIGRDDDLLRRLELESTLTGADLTAAATTSGGLVPLPAAGTKGLKSVSVSVTIRLSKFGEPVAFTRPASFQPLEKMLEALLGGLGGATKAKAKTA